MQSDFSKLRLPQPLMRRNPPAASRRVDCGAHYVQRPDPPAQAPTDQAASPSLALSLRKQACYARGQIGERRIGYKI